MSILGTIEGDIEGIFAPTVNEVEALGKQAEATIVGWANTAINDAKLAWAELEPIFAAVGPAQWTILRALVATAAADAAAGDYTAIATAVIQQATTAETAFVTQLSTQVLGVIVSIVSPK